MAKRVLSDKEVLKLTNFFQEKMIGLLEEGAISQRLLLSKVRGHLKYIAMKR